MLYDSHHCSFVNGGLSILRLMSTVAAVFDLAGRERLNWSHISRNAITDYSLPSQCRSNYMTLVAYLHSPVYCMPWNIIHFNRRHMSGLLSRSPLPSLARGWGIPLTECKLLYFRCGLVSSVVAAAPRQAVALAACTIIIYHPLNPQPGNVVGLQPWPKMRNVTGYQELHPPHSLPTSVVVQWSEQCVSNLPLLFNKFN